MRGNFTQRRKTQPQRRKERFNGLVVLCGFARFAPLRETAFGFKMVSLIAEQRTQGGRLNPRMAISKDNAVENARKDLARRLKIDAGDVKEKSVEDTDFPDMALGAAEDDEMSGQMITRGWRIKLEAKGQTFEYRADKNQVRAYDFKGKNYRI